MPVVVLTWMWSGRVAYSARPLQHVSVGVLKHRETTVYRAVESSVRPDACRRPKVVEHVAGAHQFLPDHLTGAEVERGEVIRVYIIIGVPLPVLDIDQPGSCRKLRCVGRGDFRVDPDLRAALPVRVDVDAFDTRRASLHQLRRRVLAVRVDIRKVE